MKKRRKQNKYHSLISSRIGIGYLGTLFSVSRITALKLKRIKKEKNKKRNKEEIKKNWIMR